MWNTRTQAQSNRMCLVAKKIPSHTSTHTHTAGRPFSIYIVHILFMQKQNESSNGLLFRQWFSFYFLVFFFTVGFSTQSSPWTLCPLPLAPLPPTLLSTYNFFHILCEASLCICIHIVMAGKGIRARQKSTPESCVHISFGFKETQWFPNVNVTISLWLPFRFTRTHIGARKKKKKNSLEIKSVYGLGKCEFEVTK